MKKVFKSLKMLTCLTVPLAISSGANAQADPLSYQAYVSNSKVLWERAVEAHKGEGFSLALAQYGLLNNTMADKDEDTFDEYYDATVDLLERMIADGDHLAESKAVLSSVLGLAMAYDSWKGMYLGPKSGGLIEDAFKAEADNPLVRKLYAVSRLYTPAMFGGDVEKALKNFQVAIELYETKGDTVNNWLYLDALAHLGITYQKIGETDKAVTIFERAVGVEPKFGWVKHHLLPLAEKVLQEK